MNKSDQIREIQRQKNYLVAENKFIDIMVHKLDEQKNRLFLEQLSLKTMITNEAHSLDKEEVDDDKTETASFKSAHSHVDNSDNESINLCSGTPCRPIEEPAVASLQQKDGINKSKVEAVIEPLDLDVRNVLLELASGGHQDEEEEEEEDDD